MKTRELPPSQSRSETSNTATASPSFAEGQKLGGVFLLRRELVGGDHPVWLAHDEVLGKDVSLHLIPQVVRKDEKAMADLRQEVKRNRQLIHPNILRVYDLVEEKDWTAVSMDWYEGRSLATVQAEKDGRFFEPEDVRPWLQQLCQTLGDVHKIQIVHRNVTPANLILEKSGKLLVMNFGIARVIEDVLVRSRKKGESDRNLTYLSPQQLDGNGATPSDDVYSVGATIYELLTGEPPFVGKDMAQIVRKTKPTGMMERRAKLGKRGGTILPIWENAVAQCLAKEPSERVPGMYELAARLGLSGKPAAEASSTIPVPETALVPSVAASIATEKRIEQSEPSRIPAGDPVSTEMPPSGNASKGETKPERTVKETPALAPAAPLTKPIAPSETSGPKGKEKSSVEGGGVSDIYPSLYPRRSASSLGPVAAVLAVAAVGAGIYYFSRPGDDAGTPGTNRTAETTQLHSGEAGDFKGPGVDANADGGRPDQEQPPSQPGDNGVASGEGSSQEPNATGNAGREQNVDGHPIAPPIVAEKPKPEGAREPEMLLAAKGETKRGTGKASTTSPGTSRTTTAEPEVPLPAAPDLTPQNPAVTKDPDVAAKLSAARLARQTAEASDKAVKEAREKQRQAEAAAAEVQKSLDEKAKAAAPAMQAVEDLAAQRKQREEQLKVAEAASTQARQVAEEKARQADDAKKALAEFETQHKDKLAARDKAETELQSLRTDLAEKQRLAGEAAKTVASVSETRQQQIATLKKVEEDAAQALATAEKSASEEAQKIAEQRTQQRQQIEKEIEDMKRLFEEKMKALEMLKSQVGEPASKGSSQPSASPAKSPSQPKPTPVPTKTSPSADASVGGPRPDSLVMEGGAPAASAPVAPDMATPVEPAEASATVSQSKPRGLENSLGMRFAPVGDLLFCVWPTRVKDFEAYAKEMKLKSTTWRAPGFKQGPDHPVVNVTWNDAIGFCKWLTDRERKSGALAAGQVYRLPSDLEWSKAVGLSDETGKTPEDRDMGVPDVFPWGTQWPPPPNVGNYTGEETGSDVAIKGYDDGFAWTSPVGSFPPNRYGLYDMGGNVWQWCMDAWNGESKAKVLRGASWYNGALKLSLLASCRVHANPDSSTDNFGFRVVRATDSGRSNNR